MSDILAPWIAGLFEEITCVNCGWTDDIALFSNNKCPNCGKNPIKK